MLPPLLGTLSHRTRLGTTRGEGQTEGTAPGQRVGEGRIGADRERYTEGERMGQPGQS